MLIDRIGDGVDVIGMGLGGGVAGAGCCTGTGRLKIGVGFVAIDWVFLTGSGVTIDRSTIGVDLVAWRFASIGKGGLKRGVGSGLVDLAAIVVDLVAVLGAVVVEPGARELMATDFEEDLI